MLSSNFLKLLNQLRNGNQTELNGVHMKDSKEAHSFLKSLDYDFSKMCYQTNTAEWRFASDINDENERLKVNNVLCCFSINILW